MKNKEGMKVSDIIAPLSLSDLWCTKRIARLNDIFASFSAEVYELYPMKRFKVFDKAKTTRVITLNEKYPCIHVWWFYVESCSNDCMLDKWDCCAWYKKALVDEMYWVYDYDPTKEDDGEYEWEDWLDVNAYAILNRYKVLFRFHPCVGKCIMVYSRALPKINSLDDDIDLPEEMISLLRLYIKEEYALEWDSDVNMSANYESKFQRKLKQLKEMYSNSVKFVVPWALRRVNW